tara:strand:+ start:306 stop:1709 length:1404 start_codon:yes stop_codon:yes gene_type:complete
MANILDSGFGVLNPTYGSLTKTSFDSDEAKFFDQVRKTVTENLGERATKSNGAMLGIVLRVDGYTNQRGSIDPTSWASKVATVINTNIAPDSAKLIQIRVRIPEIHSCLPIPRHLPGNLVSDDNHDIINLYPCFVARTATTIIPALGSLVWVDFQNRETMQGPIYIEPVDPSSTGTYTGSEHLPDNPEPQIENPWEGNPEKIVLFELPHQTVNQAKTSGYLFKTGTKGDNYMQEGARDAMAWIAGEYSKNVSSDLNGDFGTYDILTGAPSFPTGTPIKPFGNYLIFGDASTSKYNQPTTTSRGVHKSHKIGEDIDIGTPWNLIETKRIIKGKPIAPGVFPSLRGYGNKESYWNRSPAKNVSLDAYLILIKAIFKAPDVVVGCPKIRRIFMNPQHAELVFPSGHPIYGAPGGTGVPAKAKTLGGAIKDIAENSSSSISYGGKGFKLNKDPGYVGDHFHLRFDYKGGGP